MPTETWGNAGVHNMNDITKDGNGNTRLKPKNTLEAHLDYYRCHKGAITYDEFQLIINFIIKEHVVEFDRPWSPGAGAVFFPHKVIGTRGVVGGFNVDDDGLYSFMIDLPGEYFQGMSATDQWRLMMGLHVRYKVKCSRIDIAIDDPTYSIIPVDEMRKACNDKLNFGFRKMIWYEGGICGEHLSGTLGMGSRNSGKYVRVYDHSRECMRYEVEFKRGYAQPVFEQLATLSRKEYDDTGNNISSQSEGNISSSDNWDIDVQKTMASIAIGAIDFRDRGNRKDATRAGVRDSKRVDFYQQFIDKIDVIPFKIRVSCPAKTITKTLEWVKRQCAPTLAMLVEGFGRHNFNLWMKEIVENGSGRLNNQKQLWANEIARNKHFYCST